MAIKTDSIFYYGFEITNDNKYLPFDEGSGEINAEVQVGNYSLTEFLAVIETTLNANGTQAYTVTVDRTSRIVTITGDTSAFDLLASSGSTALTSVYPLLGFTSSDRTGLLTYDGDTASGDFYEPQFVLQSYVTEDDLQSLVNPTVNRSADGNIEVVRFGTEKFYEMDFKFISNLPQDGKVIKSNATGVEDARRFLQFCTKKLKVEFMPDKSDRNTFVTLILESTSISSDGTGYRLKELFAQNLPDYYETGVLKWRVQ